ncbi:DNA cytosine methyltransferase [Nocardioides alcanivorans]|uniref:DNA cytosine methyltransferase n=1 Tax=Nocardioides alcanivorans TaxID=2897352 RepID=UPI001F447B01|nr:DNA cytosine methyltransferase [Nocardioides alcanivorans]
MTLTVTDLFCGGGGSSTGAIQIPGIEIKIAANHWDLAVEVHNQNHPDADHAAVDLHEEDPRYFPRTDILWASPECTKWSQASGGKYSSISTEVDLLSLLDPELIDEDPETAIVQRSRLLMFDVLRFAEHHRYKAMVIENVVDIATNQKFAEAWALWRKSLERLGYQFRVVSLNSMHAQAHGDPAPQSRDRLYVVCWLKGNRAPDIDAVMRPLAWCPVCAEVVESQQVWKNGRVVGKYRSQYVYLHAACGTTVEPGYLPAAAAIDWSLRGKRIGDRAKPLADKTRRRIAAGIAKYWSPFHMESGGNQYDAADPKHPAYGNPNGYYRAWSTLDALKTLHTQETKALCVPAGGTWNDDARPIDEPHRTMTTRETTALVTRHYGIPGGAPERHTKPASEALRTVTASGGNMSIIEPPFIAELRGGGSKARSVEQPASTFTASGNHHGLVMPYYGASKGSEPTSRPIGTLTTVDRYALIQRHNSSKGDGAEMMTPAHEVMRTLTTTGHQSVITPGDIKAAEAQVDDCLFRMLEPHEVAAGMAFPADYIWSGTRRERVKLCGNAVTPPAARDLIAAVAESLA